MPEKRINKPLRFLFNPVTIVTTLILLLGMVATGLTVLFLGRNPKLAVEVTPIVTKINAPTLTPKPLEPTVISTPTPTNVFFLPEGVIGVGAYVQVTGTDGAGLRMRSEPGLDSKVNFTALDSEVFLVVEGPVETDGYTWWHLEAPYDEARNGWSAGDFLSPIEEVNDP
jgi:hypothetical protein